MSRFNNLSSLNAIKKDVTTSGTPERLSGFMIAATIAFVDSNPDTITDTGNAFLTKGFRAGDKLSVSGSASNDSTTGKEYEISTVAAGTITFTSSVELTAEAAGATVTLDTLKGLEVPPGVSVVIKAKSSNTGVITVGRSSAEALNTNNNYFSHMRLEANQAVSVQVENLKDIWIDATVSGEGVEVMLEK